MNFSCFVSAPRLLLGAALCGLTATVSSAAPVQFGVLACNVEPGVGLIIGSSKSVSCVFHPWHRRPEFYTGTISRIGLDLGGTGPGHLAWGVGPGATTNSGLCAAAPQREARGHLSNRPSERDVYRKSITAVRLSAEGGVDRLFVAKG
jgi:hypothetical protein